MHGGAGGRLLGYGGRNAASSPKVARQSLEVITNHINVCCVSP